jgi:asparagine synthase (glutamine-hydrolysing)
VGVKPLYYHIKDRVLVFGSEVRVFHQFNKNWRGDEKWKILFLAFGSIPHPYTTLENVYQLDAGAFMEINIDDFSHEVHFYSHSGRETANISSGNELSDVKDALIATIKKNLIADAPLGVFLSGGIDSSLITLLADEFKQGIKTLSINFDEATFDESPYQKQVVAKAKNVVHTSYRINEQIFWEDLPDIWRAMDQPTIDGVNSYFVSRCAHSEGLKAVLSGLGADEIFGGYASFKRVKWIRRIRKLPFKRTIAKLLKYWRSAYGRLTFLTIAGPIGDYLFLRGIHTPDVIAKILAIPEHKVWSALKEVKVGIPDKLDDRAYVSALESRIYMTNQLLKDTDCMSMWHALEARVPFLDIRLIRLMESIPVKKRYNEKVPKYLLTTCIPGLLPRDIIYRKKNGFTFPISVWLKNKPEYVRDLIDINVASQGIIDGFEKGDDHWSRCWSLAVLKQFK